MLTQDSHSPAKSGKLLECYVRPGIFGMMSLFTFWNCNGCIHVQVNSCYKGMNGERQWWMSRILYISAAIYDWKLPENSKIRLEKCWIFFFQESGIPVTLTDLKLQKS